MTHERANRRHRPVTLTRTLQVTGRCSVTIPLTIDPLTISCRFTDHVNDQPAACCVPWVPDQLYCELTYLSEPIWFGRENRHVSYWGLTIAWQLNGPAQTRSVEWTIEGDQIDLD